jgi:hypothetical protein
MSYLFNDGLLLHLGVIPHMIVSLALV